MDSFTHLVAGALTPLAFPYAPRRAALLGFGIAAGELPDIDIFFGNTPAFLMTLHRGITHALFWQPVLVLTLVLPFYLWFTHSNKRSSTSPSFAQSGAFGLGGLYCIALFAVCTHIYLDCMTTFGTLALLPFSSMRIGFPSMFIVDLLLTLPALFFLLRAWRLEPDAGAAHALPGAFVPGKAAGSAPGLVSARSRRLARIGLCWLLLYPLATLGVNSVLTCALASHLDEEEHLLLLTEPFSPFVWKSIVDAGAVYRMSTLSLFSAKAPLVESFDKADPVLFASLERQHDIFRHYAAFAPLMTQVRCPADAIAQKMHGGGVMEYSFADLRYIMSPESPARFFGRKDANFILEARVSSSGALVAYRFLDRGNDRDTPWLALP